MLNFDNVARELLRALRGSRSQTALSRRLGYRSNVLKNWEAGRRWPTAAETFRMVASTGHDPRAALTAFYRTTPSWLAERDPTEPAGVSAFLNDLRGSTPVVELARRAGRSRYAVMRWLSGEAEPRLPDFLGLVEVASLRSLDLIATLVDPARLPSVRAAWERLEAHRRTAYEMPWTQAVLRALELEAYQALPAHVPGWIAARLGIAPALEANALATLAQAGQIRLHAGRWVADEVLMVDTRQDERSRGVMKDWCARLGVERLTAGAGLFSYNVFTVSEADLERLQELHRGYFRELRAIVGASTPNQRVVVANVQLFPLDARELPAMTPKV